MGVHLGLPKCKRTNRNENVLATFAANLMQTRLTISNMLRHHYCDSPIMFWTHAGVLPVSGTGWQWVCSHLEAGQDSLEDIIQDVCSHDCLTIRPSLGIGLRHAGLQVYLRQA